MTSLLNILAGTALAVSQAAAQQPDPTPPDTAAPARVRVTARALGLDKHVATLVATGDTSITVALRWGTGEKTFEIPTRLVDRLEVSRGKRSHTGTGALTGLLIGGVFGAALGAATYQECVPQGFLDCLMAPESQGAQAALGAVAFGVVGAGLGAIIGATTHDDRWEQVSIASPAPTVSIRTLPAGGIGVGLRAAF